MDQISKVKIEYYQTTSINQWDKQEIQARMFSLKTEWYFNPRSAPHMEGSWERMIWLTRKILAQLFGYGYFDMIR